MVISHDRYPYIHMYEIHSIMCPHILYSPQNTLSSNERPGHASQQNRTPRLAFLHIFVYSILEISLNHTQRRWKHSESFFFQEKQSLEKHRSCDGSVLYCGTGLIEVRPNAVCAFCRPLCSIAVSLLLLQRRGNLTMKQKARKAQSLSGPF